MHLRKLALPVLLMVLVTGVALAQVDILDLELLWRRGQFELARELIVANSASGNRTPAFLEDAARCTGEMHDYRLAADLYTQYAATMDPGSNAYRDASYQAWANRWELTDYDPDAEWITTVLQEIDARLAETRLKTAGSKRRLALEMEYLLNSLLGTIQQPGRELRESYPASDIVLRSAREAADALATEPSHQQRLKLAEKFLEEYPGCYWRHYVWRYKLYTAWQLRQWDVLADTAADYLAEYPGEPISLGAVSRYYFDADIEFATGFDYARRSVELSETALGIDGTPASLGKLQAKTAAEPDQPDYLPPTLRDRFLQYLGSRFNLARYLVVNGEYAEALDLVLPVIDESPYSTEEYLTLAPFLLIAGQSSEGLGEATEAAVYYLAAAAAGDARNRYALQAVERLSILEGELGPDELAVTTAAFNRTWTKGLQVPHYTDVTADLGLTSAAGRRIAWADIDLDGDQDLLVDGTSLYRNDTDLNIAGAGFTDASRIWGLSSTKATSGVFADIDNDGDLDLYTTGRQRSGDRLWRNEIINRSGVPSMRMSDITSVAGAPTDGLPSEGACWTDINSDGFIDLFVANYEQPFSQEGRYGVGTPDRAYLNNGGTYFSLLDAETAGLAPPFGIPHASRGAVCACDFDNDGDQDVFVGNYRLQENFLWRNSGSGEFTNAARLLGVAGHSTEGWWGHTAGAAWGDVDNDGDFDLFTANLAHPRYAYTSDKSQLLINEHGLLGPAFNDHRSSFGIKYDETHTCPVFLDANNDGHLDLYLTSMYDGRRSFLYLNGDPRGFQDMTWLSGTRVTNGYGAAWADYDGDGDQDLAVGRGDGSIILLRNDTPPDQSSWLQVQCIGGVEDGTGSNRAGIGAQVMLITRDGHARISEVQSGSGTGCGNQLLAHFGLGDYADSLELQVRFPSGRTVYKSVTSLNQRVVVRESDGVLPPASEPTAPAEPTDASIPGSADSADETAASPDDRGLLERFTGSRVD